MTVGISQFNTVTLSPGKFHVERGYDPTVRVPDNIFKGIAFIGEVAGRDTSGRAHGDLYGTGFFVQVASPRFPHLRFAYIVTAKHVIADLKDREIYILVNDTEGGVTQLARIGPTWWLHPDDSPTSYIDVAVRQVGFQNNVDLFAVTEKDFITKEAIKTGYVALGDEVFMTGLFSPAPGTKRNMPIIRHGNVAMFPEDQIQTEFGFADAYLVEARSIGGLSGSPVFVRPPLRYGIEMPEGSTAYFDAIGKFGLLGLMHGHWDIKESKINDPQIEHDQKRGVNLGIGIVIPATKILETINQTGLAVLRKLGEENMARQNKSVPGADSIRKPESDAEKATFTKEDFEAALRQASRKKSDQI